MGYEFPTAELISYEVIENVTKVFVDLGIPNHAVEVIVHEIQKSHWGIGGEPASEKFKNVSP